MKLYKNTLQTRQIEFILHRYVEFSISFSLNERTENPRINRSVVAKITKIKISGK